MALEFEPKARAAFLEKACDGDQELRREVESLIAEGDSDSRCPIDKPVWEHDASLAETSEIRPLSPGVQVGAHGALEFVQVHVAHRGRLQHAGFRDRREVLEHPDYRPLRKSIIDFLENHAHRGAWGA